MNSDLVDLHERALSFMTSVIHGVEDRAWANSSPCDQWSVRDVVNHITAENLWAGPLMDGQTVEEVGDRFDGDVLGMDPVAAWDQAAKAAQVAFGTDDVLHKTVHVSFGDIPSRSYLEQMTTDLIIHGWDIARGSGQDDVIPADLVSAAMSMVRPMVESGQTSSVFADPIDTKEDAEEQTELLALTGRRR
jgi:uncharacterized protein (TIGR03086 family)